jgi:hypothetical protein
VKPSLLATMAESTVTVLSIPELLDIILLYSKSLDLIRLQRVCRRLRTHIVSTKAIQRRLFLEPDPKAVLVNSKDDGGFSNASLKKIASEVMPNPFLSFIFQPPSDRRGFTISGKQIYENWSLEHQVARWSDQKFLLVHLPPESNRALNSPTASWRSMTVTQPPVTHVGVLMGSPRYPGDEHPRSPDYRIISNPQGVRLGEIVDHARARANIPFLKGAPLAIAISQLASYESIYSASYYAFLRYRGPCK